MAFKALDSFLRFVSIGALVTHKARRVLEGRGYPVIELERHAGSNKIWQTKVKRLRVPDLLCIRTGIRFEVRAKSNLEIKMSHSRDNRERSWDAGMRDQDVVIFMKVYDDGSTVRVAETLNAFRVSDMRDSQESARLGPPKSSSEGAERDLTWPSWVPSRPGQIDSLTRSDDGRVRSVRVRYEDGRAYTYSRMAGKHLYLAEGEAFPADEGFLLGAPTRVAPLDASEANWDPAAELTSECNIDRYAAIKSFYRLDPGPVTDELLAVVRDPGTDMRLRLEAAGVLAFHGMEEGASFLSERSTHEGEAPEWLMESVFILTELASVSGLAEALARAADVSSHAEARAAAAWGLARAPGTLDRLLSLSHDDDDDVAVHSIMAACRHVTDEESTEAVLGLLSGGDRAAAAGCEILARSPGVDLSALFRAASSEGRETQRQWAISALIRRNPSEVRAHHEWRNLPQPVRDALEDAWFAKERSWLASSSLDSNLDDLASQSLDLESGRSPI